MQHSDEDVVGGRARQWVARASRWRGAPSLEVELGVGARLRRAYLREPTGREEMVSGPCDGWAISDVIERLLVDVPGAAPSGDSSTITVSDRDRLVAALYAHCFGDSVESHVRCPSCDKHFEFNFSLSDLLEGTYGERAETGAEGPDAAGYYALDDGTRFRLPTVEDERALYGMPEAESERALLARCVEPSGSSIDAAAVERCMEAAGPVLSFDLEASCPLCGAAQSVPFEMVSFFSSMLQRERPLLSREIHSIAMAYRWSFEEIIALPRNERRAHVALIEGERERTEAPL
ncbi:MAG TPA: hypothetical protein VF881_18400 [Polyangiaceae bacterium]